MSREEAVVLIESGADGAAEAVYSIALYDDSDSFAAQLCIAALESPFPLVRFAATGALGEMALHAGRHLDFDEAKSSLLKTASAHPELSGRVGDSLDDLEMAKQQRTKKRMK